MSYSTREGLRQQLSQEMARPLADVVDKLLADYYGEKKMSVSRDRAAEELLNCIRDHLHEELQRREAG